MNKVIYWIILLVAFTEYGLSQEVRFIPVRNEIFDGSLDCNKILEDSLGFVWLATSNGLYRYNGFDTDIFLHNPKDSNTINHNLISDIIQDGSYIYITVWGNGNTICQINMLDNSVRRITIKNDSNSAHRKILKLSNGSFALGGNKGVSFIHNFKENSSFLHIESGRPILQPSKDEILIASQNKLHTYALNEDSLVLKNIITVKGQVICTENILGKRVYGTTQGLFSFDSTLKIPAVFKKENISCLKLDSYHVLWIGTQENGLYQWNISKNSVLHFKASEIPGSLGSNIIQCLYEDKQKLLWVGTPKGPYILDLKNYGISKILLPDSSILINNALPIFEEDDGILWVGNSENIRFYDPIQKKYLKTKLAVPKATMILANACKDSFWVSSWGLGLYQVIKNKFTHDFVVHKYIETIPNHKEGISSTEILCILMDAQKNLWAGNYYTGIDIFTNQGKLIHLGVEQIGGIAISRIIQSNENTIWIGTYDAGLTKCKIDKTGNFQFKNYNPKNSSLGYRVVTSIAEDHFHQLWIGTFGGGLFKFDPIKESFISFSNAEGLPSNNIYAVECDHKNNIWCSTANGLALLECGSEKFRVFKTSDGIPENSFSFYSSCLLKNGEIAFGTSSGIALINKDSLDAAQENKSPIISRINVFNKPLFPGISNLINVNPNLVNELQLSFDQDLLSFEFSNQYYTHPKSVEFSYFLDGFDREWVHCGKSNLATFTRLPPGKYTLHVRSSIDHGTTFSQMKNPVHISILPPWWQTWWFRTLITLLTCGILYWIYRLRTERLLAMQRIEIEKTLALEHERSRISRDMHDDLGSGLSAIHLLSNYIKENTANKFPEFSAEMDQILASSTTLNQNLREIIWTTSTKDDNLTSLVNFIKKYGHGLQGAGNTSITVEVTENIEETILSSEQRKNIFLCVKESINNALKHSDCTSILIKVEIMENKKICISISDNGKGFEVDLENPFLGNGLKNIQHRMESLGGSSEIHSSPTGTTIQLILPIH